LKLKSPNEALASGAKLAATVRNDEINWIRQ